MNGSRSKRMGGGSFAFLLLLSISLILGAGSRRQIEPAALGTHCSPTSLAYSPDGTQLAITDTTGGRVRLASTGGGASFRADFVVHQAAIAEELVPCEVEVFIPRADISQP